MMVKGTRPQTVMTVKGMMNTTMKEMITKTSWHFLAFVAKNNMKISEQH